MTEKDRMPPWKSFLYAIVGAYVISCSMIMHDNPHLGGSGSVVMAIWGICFWACGTGNLFVDRRLQREAQKTY